MTWFMAFLVFNIRRAARDGMFDDEHGRTSQSEKNIIRIAQASLNTVEKCAWKKKRESRRKECCSGLQPGQCIRDWLRRKEPGMKVDLHQ